MKSIVQFVALAVVALTVPAAAMADDPGQRTLFIASAVEHPDNTATFPLHRGTSQGRTVFYILLDSSDDKDAEALGINVSRKLNNARGTTAVQKVRIVNGVVDFPATVDFRPVRQVAPSFPGGFPPSVAEPGAVGEFGYSPLIQLPNGTIRNAPHLANDTGQADKIVNLDTTHGTVTYRETNGFQNGKAVRYVSTDASNPVAATLENVTFAPALDAAPTAGRLHQWADRREQSAASGLELCSARRTRSPERALLEPQSGPLQPSVGRSPRAVERAVRRRRPEPAPDGLRRHSRPGQERARHRTGRRSLRRLRVHRQLPDRQPRRLAVSVLCDKALGPSGSNVSSLSGITNIARSRCSAPRRRAHFPASAERRGSPAPRRIHTAQAARASPRPRRPPPPR